MKAVLLLLIGLMLSGCAASAEFHEMKEFVDAEGNKVFYMVKTGEVEGKALFGGFKAKKGDAELEYTPGIKIPDLVPFRN